MVNTSKCAYAHANERNAMNVLDLIIIAAVVAVFVLCIRYLSRHNEDCADCTHADSCTAASRASGHCVAADDMMKRVDAAFAKDASAGTATKAAASAGAGASPARK